MFLGPLSWRAVFLTVSALLLFFASINASMPRGVLSIGQPFRTVARVVWPQGWAFFTRNPRDGFIEIYRPSEDGPWVKDDIGRNAELRYLLGWIRTPRVRNLEAGFLTGLVLTNWTLCKKSPGECLQESDVAPERLVNPTSTPLLCGTIGFVKQEALPWLWRHAEAETVMHSTYKVIEVKCAQ